MGELWQGDEVGMFLKLSEYRGHVNDTLKVGRACVMEQLECVS